MPPSEYSSCNPGSAILMNYLTLPIQSITQGQKTLLRALGVQIPTRSTFNFKIYNSLLALILLLRVVLFNKKKFHIHCTCILAFDSNTRILTISFYTDFFFLTDVYWIWKWSWPASPLKESLSWLVSTRKDYIEIFL